MQTSSPEALSNHRHYCKQMAYEHRAVDLSGLPSSAHRMLYKFELLLHHLRRLPDQALLLCMTQDCIVFGHQEVGQLIGDAPYLLPQLPRDGGSFDQSKLQVWRNTPEVHALVIELIHQAKIFREPSNQREEELLAKFKNHPPQISGDDHVPVSLCNARYVLDFDALQKHRTWVLILDETETYAGVVSHFRESMHAHINHWQQNGGPLAVTGGDAPPAQDDHSVYQPGQAIALILYYTPNVRIYGQIAEENILRYCQRHGHTLYVYRQTPPEAGHGLFGTWLKPWLLQRHLPQHEWALWIDADTLFINHALSLGPLLQGRDILAAHDISGWVLNAGLLGFRRTERNLALIDAVAQQILTVQDRSTTYASGGDQTVFAQRLTQDAGWSLDAGTDLFSINTPWYFYDPDRLMVHYYCMTDNYRALLMNRHNQLQKLRFQKLGSEPN
jgi:hypothetical protein